LCDIHRHFSPGPRPALEETWNLFDEQRGHRLGVRDAQHGLAHERSARQLANASACACFLAERDAVDDHQAVQRGIRNAGDRATRQYRVGTVGIDVQGAMILEGLGGLAQCACRIDHVVHDDAVAALNVTDDVHHLGHVGTRATLVDDGQIHFQALGKGTRTHHAADIGRHHHEVFHVALPDIAQQYRCGIDVVDGDIEEALDLVCVQVHGQDAVDTGDLQHVCHDL